MTRWQWLALLLIAIGVLEIWLLPYPWNLVTFGVFTGCGIGMIIWEWVDPLE